MRIFTLSLLATATFVGAIALLARVSERSAPDAPTVTEAPSAGIPDGPARDDPTITPVVPPRTPAEAAKPTHWPCTPSPDGNLSMNIRITEC
jgi:hypothetical protein